MYEAEVVVAATSGASDLIDEEQLRAALDAEGWVGGIDGVPLPDPGTLYALRELL
jgi:hypothetical protein